MSIDEMTDTERLEVRARIAFLLRKFWGGDRNLMARNIGISPGILRDVIRPTKRVDPGILAAVVGRIKTHRSISGVWLETGHGEWRKAPMEVVLEGVKAPAPPSPEEPAPRTPGQARAWNLLREVWHGDEAAMCQAVGMNGRLSAILDRDAEPTPDEMELIELAAFEHQAGPKPVPTSVPEPSPAAPPEPDAIDTFLGLARKIDGLEGRIDTRVEVGLRQVEEKLAGHMAKLHAKTDQIDRTWDRMGILADQFARLEDRVRTLASSTIGPGTLMEAIGKTKDAARADLHEATRLIYKHLNALGKKEVEAVEKVIEETLQPLEARLSRLETAAKDSSSARLKDRLDSLTAAVGNLRQDVLSLEDRPAPEPDPRPEQLAAGLAALGRALTELTGRVGALESEPNPAAKVIAMVPPAPRPRPQREADLNPEDILTLAEWCALPGPHQRIVRDDDDRNTMGRRISGAYRQCHLEYRAKKRFTACGKYPVRDLRHYAAWLSTAGLDPEMDGWLAYFRTHALPAWNAPGTVDQ